MFNSYVNVYQRFILIFAVKAPFFSGLGYPSHVWWQVDPSSTRFCSTEVTMSSFWNRCTTPTMSTTLKAPVGRWPERWPILGAISLQNLRLWRWRGSQLRSCKQIFYHHLNGILKLCPMHGQKQKISEDKGTCAVRRDSVTIARCKKIVPQLFTAASQHSGVWTDETTSLLRAEPNGLATNLMIVNCEVGQGPLQLRKVCSICLIPILAGFHTQWKVYLMG